MMLDVNILATLGSAAVGAVIGSYGTYWARERSRLNEQEERIENLRRSLIAELGSMEELATEKASNYRTQIPVHSTISAEVYKSNSSDISLLEPKEAEAIIRFYSGAIRLEQTLDTTRDLLTESENPQQNDLTALNESIDILRQEWKDAVLVLLSNLDDYPSAVRTEHDEVKVDDSMSTGDLWIVLNHKRLSNDSNIDFVY
jgi:polyhydroxyalkanoate synthesis regulator phasin